MNRPQIYVYSVYPPCKDCDKRKPACHDNCQDYKSYREKIETEHKVRSQYSELSSYILSHKHYPEYSTPKSLKYVQKNRNKDE